MKEPLEGRQDRMKHTSHIPNTRPSKHSNELARRAAIIADGYNISQSTMVLLNDLVEDIHQTIGSRAAGEDDHFALRRGGHCMRVCAQHREEKQIRKDGHRKINQESNVEA